MFTSYAKYSNMGADATQRFTKHLSAINPQLASYLSGLKGASPTLRGYAASLAGATLKTIGLQAASMALNAALTWGISLAIQGIITGITALWKLVPTTEHLKESLSETANALSEIRSERESLNDELKTTSERIAELEAKGTLSFTDEAELTRLKRENAELERKIALLDDEEKKEENKYQKKFNKLLGSDRKTSEKGNYYDIYQQTDPYRKDDTVSDIEHLKQLGQAWHDAKMSADGYFTDAHTGYRLTESDIKSQIDGVGETVKDYQSYLEQLYENGFDYNSSDATTKANVDFANEMIDTYMVIIGATDALWGSIFNRDKFAEANKEITNLANSGQLTAQSLQALASNNANVQELLSYLMSLGTIDWTKFDLPEDFDYKTLDSNKDGVVSFTEAMTGLEGKGVETADVMSLFATELNKVEDAAEDTESSIKSMAQTLADSLEKLADKKDILEEVKDQINEFGAISADNISSIVDKFSDNDAVLEIVAGYLAGINTAEELYAAMANGYQDDLKAQAKLLSLKMANNEKYYEAIGGTNQKFVNYMRDSVYGVDLSNCKDLASAKLQVENKLIQNLKDSWGTLHEYKTGKTFEENYRQAQANKWRSKEAYEIAQQYQTMYDAMQEIDNLSLNKFDTTGFNTSLTTSFDDDNGKTAAEKYFDDLKHQRELDKISQKEYLIGLYKGYKDYYKDNADFIDEQASTMEELYDGFKELYKEDFEAKKESLEKQKEEVEKYYDNLIDEIKEAHDAEDYEEEQAEKRKTIFELKAKIEDLLRDGSQRALAKAAELQEELADAEKELFDFERDNARENEIDRLEKEKESKVNSIENEVKKIDEKLSDIDEGINGVSQKIVDFAKGFGVTITPVQQAATGTLNARGGLTRINEKGLELIATPDGHGNYVNMLPASKVLTAQQTSTLMALSQGQLPQAMYNSIARSIGAKVNSPAVNNYNQPISITMGDVIIQGNADKQTVASIRKQQEDMVRLVLNKIKELQS